MDKKQLHMEFMSILGESHPGLTFEEYRDSCVFLLFYKYCCLRFGQELDDSYKLKEMVRMAVRGKLQIPSFLKFIESASAYIHRASGQFELTPDSDNLRCPYQASVMKTLLSMSSKMVYSPFISSAGIRPCSEQHGDRHP